MAPSFASLDVVKQISEAAKEMKEKHIKELLMDEIRTKNFFKLINGVYFDFSRQKLDRNCLSLLIELATEMDLPTKIEGLFNGIILNPTEERAVLHTALRSPSNNTSRLEVGGRDIFSDIQGVLHRIRCCAHDIRSGERLGSTGKLLKDVICVGIGGSYLGPEFVYEALRTDPVAMEGMKGRRLRFLSNVDPVDFRRATEGLLPETTLLIVISKTFTTRETMLNAMTVRQWLLSSLKSEQALSQHMLAISTNITATSQFGINPDSVFGFWDWVGGRYSVTSAVGVLPLTLHFGWSVIQEFLNGANSMDNHFRSAPLEDNLPVLMGLISIWNSTFLGYDALAIIPYCQPLLRFPAHLQQLMMESNGKRVTAEGENLQMHVGEIVFGEPGTNAQHSFYQLLHQGRVIPAELIAACKSQNPVSLLGEPVSNHDELMANFFAQADALALGKSADELKKEGVCESLIPHKTFPGDRPSSMLLLPSCSAFYVGYLLALYEHRTAVQGFLWGINSFDQWGVELGKALAKSIRSQMIDARNTHEPLDRKQLLPSTYRILSHYLTNST